MAETASTVIRDALQEILVKASEQPIQPNEATDAIRYLNRMMTSWEAQGYALGYTIISGLGDEITVPDGALEGIVLNLAVKLAPQYDVQLTPTLIRNARTSFLAIKNLTIDVGPAPYQSTLPIGSGNEQLGFNTPHFYNDETSDILAETTGNIVQEDNDNG